MAEIIKEISDLEQLQAMRAHMALMKYNIISKFNCASLITNQI